MRAEAAAIGREIGVFTRTEITCRPTQKEAADYYRYWVEEKADWGAVDHQMKISRKMTPDMPDYYAKRKLHLHGFPIVGDPDRVASMLATLSRGRIQRRRHLAGELSRRAAVPARRSAAAPGADGTAQAGVRSRASYTLLFGIALVCAAIAYVAKPHAPNGPYATYYYRAMAALAFVMVAIVLKLIRETFDKSPPVR